MVAGELPAARPAGAAVAATSTRASPVTATTLYVNLAQPERAHDVAAMAVDGVGLLRAEFMILDALDGTHPRRLLTEGRGEEFVERMAAKLGRRAPTHRGGGAAAVLDEARRDLLQPA